MKRFVPEKVIEEYQKDTKLANAEGRTLTNEIFWLEEYIPCPMIKENMDRFVKILTSSLNKHMKIQITEEEIRSYFVDRICEVTPCICGGTSKIQRVNDPKFWEESKS